MKTVSITFVGDNSDKVAQAFYTWVVDGGLEDYIVEGLDEQTDANTTVDGIMDINNDTLDIAMKTVSSD